MKRLLMIGLGGGLLAAALLVQSGVLALPSPRPSLPTQAKPVGSRPADRASGSVTSSLTPSKADGLSAANRTDHAITSSLEPVKTSPGALNQVSAKPLTSTLTPLSSREVNPNSVQTKEKIKSMISPR